MGFYKRCVTCAVAGWAVVLVLMGPVAFAGADEGPEPAGAVDPIKVRVGDYESLQRIIKQAVEEAEAGGQNQVHIHLEEDPGMVQPADLVTLHYSVADAAGRIIHASRADEFARRDARYAAMFSAAGPSAGPVTVLAGLDGDFPGLAHAVLGMGSGQRRTVAVSAEKGFGPREAEKKARYARQRVLPDVAEIPLEAFSQRFGGVPDIGREVPFSPYFSSRVVQAEEQTVRLAHSAENGKVVQEPFGTTRVAPAPGEIRLILDPVVGAPFVTDAGRGVVTGRDETHFVVDYNHPLAGESLTFDVQVVALQKYSLFEKIDLPWAESYESAMELAVWRGQPIVLVLHAEWCGWCKRMFDESFADPRVKQLHDRLVWLRIDSDKQPAYMEQFSQTSFPTIVLMDSKGAIVQRMEGFQDAATLHGALRRLLAAARNER